MSDARRKAAGGEAPRPAEIKARRESLGLTQKQAAELVLQARVQFTRWEREDGPAMPPPTWELFLAKTSEGYERPRAAVGYCEHPSAESIRSARRAAGMTEEEAAGLLGMSARTWMYWEKAYEDVDPRLMHAALWELFLTKAGLTGWEG